MLCSLFVLTAYSESCGLVGYADYVGVQLICDNRLGSFESFDAIWRRDHAVYLSYLAVAMKFGNLEHRQSPGSGRGYVSCA